MKIDELVKQIQELRQELKATNELITEMTKYVVPPLPNAFSHDFSVAGTCGVCNGSGVHRSVYQKSFVPCDCVRTG